MSTGGLQGPRHDTDDLGFAFVGFYCLIGVPLFGAFVSAMGSVFFNVIFCDKLRIRLKKSCFLDILFVDALFSVVAAVHVDRIC